MRTSYCVCSVSTNFAWSILSIRGFLSYTRGILGGCKSPSASTCTSCGPSAWTAGDTTSMLYSCFDSVRDARLGRTICAAETIGNVCKNAWDCGELTDCTSNIQVVNACFCVNGDGCNHTANGVGITCSSSTFSRASSGCSSSRYPREKYWR